MRVLALEASGPGAGVALTEGGRVLDWQHWPDSSGHLPRLTAACRTVLADHEPDLIAVTVGPGSFTGLRTALGLAKGLAWARGKPLVAVTTLELLAANAPPGPPVLAVTDARRGQVFAALYHESRSATFMGGGWREASPIHQSHEKPAGTGLLPPARWDPDALAQELLSHPGNLRGVGNGLKICGPLLAARLGTRWTTLPDGDWIPDPRRLAVLAPGCLHSTGPADPMTLEPLYLRPSDAESSSPR
ncbi:MAG: tRNA (adenosine(37)-N6)-threonylcarbamoyltransferase complex dimerization subunit type 1 TsaB [Magnetococcales bacterium]|nr:tRNA (adenosine(37)-N6)-threonylcarbamoyltransferase complex dimerization subunit type 1 TsaB [Magnetococcales bacterium]